MFENETRISDINLIFSCNDHQIRSVRCLSETKKNFFKIHSKDVKGKDNLQYRREDIIKVNHERTWTCRFAQVWGPVAPLLRMNNKS